MSRVAVFAVGILVLAGCGAGAEDPIVVSAAASLSDAFVAMESAFEEGNPGSDVVVNLGSSSSLREQVLAGAPADVYASANESNMDRIVAGGLVRGAPVIFAANELAIAVPADNPAGVEAIADLARPDVLVGLCAAGVPCGDFAREALDRAGVRVNAASEEPNVRALLTKIEAGELDAGVVYATDVTSVSVSGIALPDGVNLAARYPIAALAGGSNPEGGQRFVDFVLSAAGRQILLDHGFGTP